jgi:tetrahydromethanopterin S-methyltransferase subunit G
MERTQNFAANASGKPSSERFDEFEPGRSEFEDRLNDIAKRINELHYKCDVVNSTDSRETCEPGVELRVKAEAARWMLRVAKHLTGPTREKVFTAVQKSLDDIEKIVASYPQPVAGNVPRRRVRAAHAAAGR